MRIESGRMLNDYIQPNKKQYCIPVFQRDYAWTAEQCEKLFEDIVLAFKKIGYISVAPSFTHRFPQKSTLTVILSLMVSSVSQLCIFSLRHLLTPQLMRPKKLRLRNISTMRTSSTATDSTTRAS